jgi:hypothetical protein
MWYPPTNSQVFKWHSPNQRAFGSAKRAGTSVPQSGHLHALSPPSSSHKGRTDRLSSANQPEHLKHGGTCHRSAQKLPYIHELPAQHSNPSPSQLQTLPSSPKRQCTVSCPSLLHSAIGVAVESSRPVQRPQSAPILRVPSTPSASSYRSVHHHNQSFSLNIMRKPGNLETAKQTGKESGRGPVWLTVANSASPCSAGYGKQYCKRSEIQAGGAP